MQFFCWKWQIVLFHYAWRLNNVFLEWMSFVATLSQASWSILYLWEKLSDLKTFSYTFLRPGWIVCYIRKEIFCFRYFFLTFCQWHYYLISICDIHKNTHLSEYAFLLYLRSLFACTVFSWALSSFFYNPLFHVKLMLILW